MPRWVITGWSIVRWLMAALNLLNVDRFGLDDMDRRIMLTIIDKFQGGPIGLETLATVVCEEKTTLEDVYEPFLIQSRFLPGPRGGGWQQQRHMSISVKNQCCRQGAAVVVRPGRLIDPIRRALLVGFQPDHAVSLWLSLWNISAAGKKPDSPGGSLRGPVQPLLRQGLPER